MGASPKAVYPDGYARLGISGVGDEIEIIPVTISEGGKNNFQTWRAEKERRMAIDVEFPAEAGAWSDGWISFKASKDGTIRLSLLGPYVPENGKRKMIRMMYDDLVLEGAVLVNGDFETRSGSELKGWTPYYTDNKDLGPKVLPTRGVGESAAVMAWHDGGVSQAFAVKKDQIVTLKIKCRIPDAMDFSLADESAVFLDLKSAANMGFADETAGDGKGGWSDQGPDNDLRSFDPKRTDFGGVPFQIISPEKNQGRAVMSFRGATLAVPLTEARIDMKRPAPAKNLYILHTTCFNQTKGSVGTVTVHLQGGGEKNFDIKSAREVADWWGAGNLPNGAVVFKQPNRTTAVGLYLSRLDLGELENVSGVSFKSSGSVVWIVVGATLSTRDIPLPVDRALKFQANDEWKVVDLSEVRIKPGSALDLSALVEPGPSGKYGRVKPMPGGALVFENRPEKEVRFFSFQILVNHLFEKKRSALEAPTEEETRANIREWASLVRRQGYNLVRLQSPELYLKFGIKEDYEINAVNLARFDYLVACLKEEGVYYGVDLMSFTGWKAESWNDGLAKRYRERFLVDDDSRSHWETGVRQFFTHVNPLTKTSLANDPSVVFVTCYNEQDLAFLADATFNHPDFRPMALAKWRAFLAAAYRDNPSGLSKTWGLSEAGAAAMYQMGDIAGGGNRAADVGKFLFQLEDNMAAWYLEKLKSFGYTGLAIQYDVLSQYLHHAVHARNNVVANHGYHGHPSDGSNPGSRVQQDGTVSGAGAYFRSRLAARFLDRPFLITEYGSPYWGRYRHEEAVLFPAYAGLQGIQGITVHAQAVVLKADKIMEDFTVGRDPIGRASQVLAAFLYGRGDVAASKKRLELVLSDDWVFQGGNVFKSVESGLTRLSLLSQFGLRYEGRPVPNGIPPAPAADLSFKADRGGEVSGTAWTATTVDVKNSDTAARAIAEMRSRGILKADNLTDHDKGVYQSDTGEIFLDSGAERMSVTTARSCGIVLKAGASGNAGNALVAKTAIPAAIGLASLDGKTLAESGRLLLLYITDAVNSGLETSEDRVVLKKMGELPILVQSGKASFKIKNARAGKLRCWAVGMDGSRNEELALRSSEAGSVELDLDTSKLKKGPALYFELAAE